MVTVSSNLTLGIVACCVFLVCSFLCVFEFVLILLFFSIVVVFLAELVCVWWPVGRSVGLGDWRHERV